MREGWEIPATRHMERRLNFIVPAMFAGAVTALFVLAVFTDWQVGSRVAAMALALTLLVLSAVYAVARRGMHSDSKLFGPSVVWTLDPGERKASLARIRRGQPAPDADRAVVDVRIAERMLRVRWPAFPLAAVSIVTLAGTPSVLPLLILTVGLLVWLGYTLIAAKRCIAANRALWSV